MRHALQLFNDWDNLFSDSFFAPQVASPNKFFEPASDVEETETHFIVNVDLPGISKEDIKIEVKDDHLTIWGERKADEKGEKEGIRYHRRAFGKFTKSFALPAGIDASKIEATQADGVLSVAVPKAPEAQPHAVKIGDAKGGFFEKFKSKKNDPKEVH